MLNQGLYFLVLRTLVDVTEDEFLYILSNIFLTTRYGAESNREDL
ncbi:hypothetical protein [Caloramator sp. mosi_1]